MKYCGREFSDTDIKKIRQIISAHPELPREHIARAVCENFGWRKPDGGLKDMSCKVALLRMHRGGMIQLPPPRRKGPSIKPFSRRTPEGEADNPVNKFVHELKGLRLRKVSNHAESQLWNEYIERYHYLGYKRLPGAQLRYFIDHDKGNLALLGFGAAAWRTAPREKYIGWSDKKREERLHLIVNNARLLILPWIRCQNLVSWILGKIAKQLPVDWEKRYRYRPVLLETFVEDQKFSGLCYKASNWRYLGKTQGLGKINKTNTPIPIKSVWVYPLTHNFREYLTE